MSADPQNKEPKLRATIPDPGRAVSLSAEEHRRLLEDLGSVVLPILDSAGRELIVAGFIGVESEVLNDMASLTVSHNALECWFRIVVHRTFGLLMSRDPVFWMYAVYNGTGLVHGTPGRLANLESSVVRRLAAEFVRLCKEARG